MEINLSGNDTARFYVRAYDNNQREAIIALWNSSETGRDFRLNPELWEAATIYNRHFEPGDFTGAWTEAGKLAGFVLTRRFRDPDAPEAMRERVGKLGWLCAILVAPEWRGQGLGSRLLELAVKRLEGVSRIRTGGEIGHLLPGVPESVSTTFFEKRGFHFEVQPEFDLARSLADWQDPPGAVAGEYVFRQAREGEESAILAFLRDPANGFSARWPYDLETLFRQGYAPENITLLVKSSGVIEGFCQTWRFQSFAGRSNPRALLYWAAGERPGENHGSLGPLGIAAGTRGSGLGLTIVAQATAYLKSQGVSFATIDWTHFVDFYGRLGYQPWRTYRVGSLEP
jgi:GNAT superfamily N-acetyltransferase